MPHLYDLNKNLRPKESKPKADRKEDDTKKKGRPSKKKK
jgi:hypothetical protein